MALQKTIPTPYGVDLTYWKITRLNIDWLNQIGEVFLGGWPNQQARLNGVQGEMHDNNPFTGATDVYEPGQPGERP
jgi:hypothetical protein